MDRSPSELLDLLNAHSREVAYDLVEPLLRVLIVARETCGGDLEQALVMIAISLRSSRHPDFRNLEEAEVDLRETLPGFGTNIRSVADSTGMARETTRRKVTQLIEAGWVVRRDRRLCYSAEGYRAVEPVRQSIMQMYARGYGVMAALERQAYRPSR